MADLHLVRDLLDKLIVDRNGREVGRADSVVLELRDNRPPRVARIEIGPGVLFARVSPLLGRWAAALQIALGAGDGQPLAVPYAAILDLDRHVRVDLPEKP